MLKVTLKYTDCMLDGKTIFRILAEHNVIILKTKYNAYSTDQKVMILVDGISSLNALLSDLNSKSLYGATVVKTKVVKEKKYV